MADATLHTPPADNPWPKRIGLALLGLAALAVFAVIGVYLWLGSSAGRSLVEARIEAMEIAGQSVELDELDGSVLGAFEIDRLVLSDRNGEWLVARDVSADWNPWEILSKRLDVDRLRIGDVDVLNRPVFVSSGSTEDPRITTFRVGDIELPDVFLSETVAGRAVALSATGDFVHGPDGGAGKLVARTDQGDSIDADLVWSPLLVLSGEADVRGEPGGLIAGLLRLDETQTFTADVTTADSQTRVAASVGGADVADLTIERGQSRIAIAGTIDAGRLPALEGVAPLLGGEARIDAVLPLDQDAPAQLDVDAPRLSLDAAGTRRNGEIVLSRFVLDAQDPLEPFQLDGVSIGQIMADGRVTIGERYAFDGRLDARALRYRDYAVDRLQGSATLESADGVLSFDGDLTGQASTGLAARADGAALAVTGQLNTDSRSVTLSQADIDLPGLTFRGQGSVGYGETPSTTLQGRYDVDTSIFRDEPRARLRGEATVRNTADGPVADLSGRATRIEGLASAVEPLAEGGLDYTARLRFVDGAVRVPQFTARNERLRATGSALWRDGRIEADVDYSVDRYAFAAVAATDISGEATVSGPVSEIAFDTVATAGTLDAGALETTQAEIAASGTYTGGVITTSGTLAANSEQGRIETSGDIVMEDGNWEVSGLEGTLGELTATGGLSGVGGDIAAIRGDLVLSGRSPLIPAESIDATIRLGDARVDVDALVTDLNYWRLEDATVRLVAQGPREEVVFNLAVNGDTRVRDVERELAVSAAGAANLTQDNTVIAAEFGMNLGELQLAGLAETRRTPNGWSGLLDADGLDGTLDIAFTPGPEGGIAFTLDGLSVPQIAALLARPATEGRVSGEGAFRIVDEHVEGQATVALNELRSPISDAEPVSIETVVTLENEKLRAVTRATDGGLEGSAIVVGPVRTLPRAPYLVYPPDTPLQGRADLSGQIGPIAEIFLPPQTDVAGRVETNLRFTVPHRPDALLGRFEVSDGAFEQGAIGLRLRDITMVAELSGDTVTVPTLSARGVDGGTLQGSGRMGIGDVTGSVNIEADRLRVISRREGRAEVSGQLDVTRTTELLRLGGDLQVTDADLNIARLPEPGLPTLEVDFGDAEEEAEQASFASTTTEMDIRIRSNGRINVTGRGLDAAMSMDARVVGSFNDPVVTGDMSIERGRFDFLSKRFEFRDSSVVLRDQIMQSILNFEAIRRTPDLTAVVSITGTLDRPEIELTSEPNLPEDEVLSRILFGRSPTQLSAIEAARLAAALAQLSGGSGFDLFGSLENAIGLDTLEIGQSDTGQTQLTTGKYLSDNVYLEVRTAAEGTPGIAVEWQVRDNISVEGETVPNVRERLSVQWKRDFD